MMGEAERPFFIRPFRLTSYRPVKFGEGLVDANQAEPYTYYAPNNFQQNVAGDVDGGNCYYNDIGDWGFEGNGILFIAQLTNPLIYHPGEIWTDEVDFYNQRTTIMSYGVIEVTLMLNDRFEDHIPFKDVAFEFRFTKNTRKTEQIWTDSTDLSGNETTIPGVEIEIENSDEEVSFTFTMPDDINLGRHRFDSFIDLDEEERVDKGYIYPEKGAGGNFHDGDAKYGFDAVKHEQEEKRVYLDDPPKPGEFYALIKKITRTFITYDLTGVEETCTPATFYNQS